MSTARGTSNTNVRGSASDRRARKRWLLEQFGNGVQAPCPIEGCDVMLTFDTITVDRFPIMGHQGGTYVRTNIRPACLYHNSSLGSLDMHLRYGHTLKGMTA